MTGFGYAESTNDDFMMAIEIKSYNNRYLEIDLNLPPSFSRLEERLRRNVSERSLRGRIEVYIRLKEFSETIEVIVNREGVEAHMKALASLIEIAGIEDQIHLGHLLRLEGVLKSYSINNAEKYWPILEPIFADAFAKFDTSRRTEGRNIEKSIFALIDDFNHELQAIIGQEPAYKDKITTYVKEKFKEVLGNEADETRVLQEIASLLLKSDIHEEIVRLQSHMSSFRETLKEDAAIGKKLDFLCQELNREINTIGAKSFVYEINTAVIACKEIIERLRELLRNVE
jgi:uncharacterized protein (TIGR00255 family)